MKVLYISHDGITDHIGKSQRAPYLLGLAKNGHDITILSNEKDIHSKDIQEYRSLFTESSIKWFINPYSNRIPIISPLLTSIRQYLKAKKICLRDSFNLIHSRCYVSSILGYFVKKSLSDTKLLFDLRDFWIDTRIERRKLGFLYRPLKIIEGSLFRNTDSFICLTEKAKSKIARMGDQFDCTPKVTVIPCCADMDLFKYDKENSEELKQIRQQEGLDGSFVLTYLGSIGAVYLLPNMVKTFKILKYLDSSSKFLFIANNGKDEVVKEFLKNDLNEKDLVFKTLIRSDVPKYLEMADLSLVFIRPSDSKIGCSPTKLAELLAMGIPVLANKGVGDLNEILCIEKNNSICLDSFDENHIRENLLKIKSQRVDKEKIREFALKNFSLPEAIRRYDAVYKSLSNL
jgi:glycosyltransferase involved in cell wall biosynthesis